MTAMIDIREGGLDQPEVHALLRAHLDTMAVHSPPESRHALDLSGLRVAEVTFWTVWEGDALVGCGALKQLSPEHGEVKSMHTAAAHRGKGIAGRIVEHAIATAKARGYRRLSLETGSMEGFAPARALYQRHGFTYCGPFGDYKEDPHSVFMTLALG
ncbi:MAG: GNAT family N-acetyltransferase [Thalassobaculaceae bacterium]|nr:GNAT family N-acetyltransferase [Thalassobaculaceae bacterium]